MTMTWGDWFRLLFWGRIPERRYYTGIKELVIYLRDHHAYHELNRFLDDGWRVARIEGMKATLWTFWTAKNPRTQKLRTDGRSGEQTEAGSGRANKMKGEKIWTR
jgi:hypothetical protein